MINPASASLLAVIYFYTEYQNIGAATALRLVVQELLKFKAVIHLWSKL